MVAWGIVGTGNVAKEFAAAFPHAANTARLIAVASRSIERARAFGAPRAYGDLDALLADREVDAVYVAVPNAFHFDVAARCVCAGKAVLLEKPFTVNAREAVALVELARERRVFLMEAMWTRFVPAVRQALAWIREGAIGDVRLVEASFGFRAEPAELPALLSKELAVGSLLDVGVYPVSLAQAAFGRAPIAANVAADLDEHGVDRQAAFILAYDGGGLACGSSAVTHETRHDAAIAGTRGRIHLAAPFWCAPSATLSIPGFADRVITEPGGYEHEVNAASDRIGAGALEHELMPLDESVAIMRVLDRLREAAGVRFPADA